MKRSPSALTTIADRIGLARVAVGQLAGRRSAARPRPTGSRGSRSSARRPARRGRARRAAPRPCCAACRAPWPRPSSGPRWAARICGLDSKPPAASTTARGVQLVARPVGVADGDARERAVVAAQEVLDRGAVAQLDPVALGGGAVLGHQALAAVDRADRQPAPEPLAPVDLVGLALVHEPEAHALARAASARAARESPTRIARHRLVAAPERDPPHVGEEVLLGVRGEVGARGELVVDALDDVAHVLEPAVGEADRARGEGRSCRPTTPASAFSSTSTARSALARGVRGAQPGVARRRRR